MTDRRSFLMGAAALPVGIAGPSTASQADASPPVAISPVAPAPGTAAKFSTMSVPSMPMTLTHFPLDRIGGLSSATEFLGPNRRRIQVPERTPPDGFIR